MQNVWKTATKRRRNKLGNEFFLQVIKRKNIFFVSCTFTLLYGGTSEQGNSVTKL